MEEVNEQHEGVESPPAHLLRAEQDHRFYLAGLGVRPTEAVEVRQPRPEVGRQSHAPPPWPGAEEGWPEHARLAAQVPGQALGDEKGGALDAVVENGRVPRGVRDQALQPFFVPEAAERDLMHEPTCLHFRETEAAAEDASGVEEGEAEEGGVDRDDAAVQDEVGDLRKRKGIEFMARIL